MHNSILTVVGFWFIQFYCIQAEVNLVFQDVEAPYLNPEYVRDFEGYITDDEEAAIYCNVTFVKTLPPGCKGHLVLKGASMGEYVVSTGIDFSSPFCEMFDDVIIMGRLMEIFGFKREECPPLPRVYGTERFVGDIGALPDTFPSNNYLVIFEIIDAENAKLAVFHLYLRIY